MYRKVVTIWWITIGSSRASFTSVAAGHGKFGSVAAPFKFFDIPHPSKEFPHRLRYSCLEDLK